MPCGAQRRRRSNAVGSASPTSPPRCTSRHCTAPGKCLHRARCGPQRWRRTPDRDLCDAGRRRDQRQARVAQGATRGVRPTLERRPPRHRLGRDRPGTDAATDGRDWLSGDRPQRERHRDRCVAVVPSRCHAARNHRENRAAAHASIAPATDHDPARHATSVERSAELTIATAVAVEPEPTADRPRGRPAVDACARPGKLHRGRCGDPPLDVERVMNDSWSASGRFQ